jgi:parvulin-like peptidyl-prolyl isomerase
MKNVLYAIVVLVLLLISCRQQKSKAFIARVGNVELTLEEAKTHIDTSRGSITHQLYDYAAYWANVELIYQEAIRQGIENSEQFNRQLKDVRRQLANQTFLERNVYTDAAVVDNNLLHEYFQSHAAEFFVREDMMKLNLILFKTREQASTFAASIARGVSWNEAVEKIVSDTSGFSGVVSVTSEQFYTQRTMFPPELWKMAMALNVKEISFPVKTALGYYVVQPIAIIKQGEPAQFELVREEVHQRFLIDQRRHRYDELLGTLRKRYNVEILLNDVQPTDSARTQSYE